MLYKVKTLKGYRFISLDGEIGKVSEFFFDDKHWAIRYLVADTGDWLQGRLVLISPYALLEVNNEAQTISIDLTMNQIEESPFLEKDQPVLQQFKDAYYGYYGWPKYWGGPHMWGSDSYVLRDRKQWGNSCKGEEPWSHKLRNTEDLIGHHIQATDGEIGHVEDFIIDDESWAIRYLVIDTQNWWAGKKVLLSPVWIERISWEELKVYVNLLHETIQQSPEYSEALLLTREYEAKLHRHYKRPAYWDDQVSEKLMHP